MVIFQLNQWSEFWGVLYSDFNKTDSIHLNTKKRAIIIRPKNAINQPKIILLEFFPKSNDKVLSLLSDHVIDNFKEYKYSLKAFIDKQSLIHKSANLNLDTKSWFNKAFCNLYMKADKIRNKEKLYENYRQWEEFYFYGANDKKGIINSREEQSVLLDIGAGYGRLEELLIKKDKDESKIKKIYAIDLSQTLLNSVKKDGKIETMQCDFRTIDLMVEKKFADFALFIYTTFGYFDNDIENREVLKKAYNLIKSGGKIIIEQFNPYVEPEHCKKEKRLDSFPFKDHERDYKLLKTSNFKEPFIGEQYALYYGNYVYFDTSNKTEEMIKCDAYSIKLYTEDWFNKFKTDGCDIKFVYFEKTNEYERKSGKYYEVTYVSNGGIIERRVAEEPTEVRPSIMVVEIIKKPEEEIIRGKEQSFLNENFFVIAKFLINRTEGIETTKISDVEDILDKIGKDSLLSILSVSSKEIIQGKLTIFINNGNHDSTRINEGDMALGNDKNAIKKVVKTINTLIQEKDKSNE